MSSDRERIRLYEVSRRVGEILHYVWDPIGIARMAEARDEYDAYVPTVTGMLMRGAEKKEIATFLTYTSVETMGLSATPAGHAHDEMIADMLLQHFRVVDEPYKKG
jgi:hypothetical protein